MKNKRGISLISLVITIIVIIIIAGAIILTINTNNPLENAKKSKFQSDIRTFQEELALYHGKKSVETNGMYQADTLNADTESIQYTGAGTIDTTGSIFNIITTLKGSKYEFQIGIVKGDLSFLGGTPKEIAWANELGLSSEVTEEGCNIPNPSMVAGMIPVYYDESTKTWKKADITNQEKEYQWYNYSTDQKQWANVVTVLERGTKSRQEYMSSPKGTTIAMNDITTMFVWVPRYAYSIQKGAYKTVTKYTNNNLDIKFLVGKSNQDTFGRKYETDYDATKVAAGKDTPYIVHPAFQMGGQQVRGLWVAKFEASANPNSNGRYPGNIYQSDVPNSVGSFPYIAEKANANTYLKIVPGVPSWGRNTVGNAFSLCQKLQITNTTSYGLASNDAHLMKNTEWGAVAYLSASEYGVIPDTNCAGIYVRWKAEDNTNVGDYRNITAGAGMNPNGGYDKYDYTEAAAYDTSFGKKTSTTGNVYGIYDMAGGMLEYVSAYLDNNNATLMQNGSTLINADHKYKEIYEVSTEEKNNTIQNTVTGSGTLTQTALWNSVSDDGIKEVYNKVRSRITTETYRLMASHKGDAMYETIQEGNIAFYGRIKPASGTSYDYNWIKDANTNVYENVANWDSDLSQIGHSVFSFIGRGGYCDNSNGAGVFYITGTRGNESGIAGFRPVIATAL